MPRPALAPLTFLGLALALSPGPAAAQTAWPGLPTDHFMTGRAATQQDVQDGNALFALAAEASPTPLELEIPQYAVHRNSDTGEDEGVIVLQAESASGQRVVGYVRVQDQQLGVDVIESFELLGTSVPTRPVPVNDPQALIRADYTSKLVQHLKFCSGQTEAQRELCACYETGKGSDPVGVSLEIDAQGLPTTVGVLTESEFAGCLKEALGKSVFPAPPSAPWRVQVTLSPNEGS